MRGEPQVQQEKAPDSQQALELFNELEQRFDQLNQWHHDNDQFVDHIRTERTALDARRAELDSRVEQLDERDRQFDTERSEFEQHVPNWMSNERPLKISNIFSTPTAHNSTNPKVVGKNNGKRSRLTARRSIDRNRKCITRGLN